MPVTLAGGTQIGAVEFIGGLLLKTAVLYTPNSGGNDVIYGGLGNDFIHGGAGDDAISGAEAQAAFYNTLPDTLPAASGFYAPDLATAPSSITSTFNPINPLGYDSTTRKLAAYDANHPKLSITNFFLNFDASDSGNKINDGKDRIFGDNDNDWLVGGTGHNRLFGGMGDDLMNADNNLGTATC